MSWMKSTYQAYYGFKDINADAVTTGKSFTLFGISGRIEATGLGVFTCTKQLLNDPLIAKRLKIPVGLKDKTLIVQGFGNVGYWAAHFFQKAGAKVIALAEYEGAILDENGLDVEAVFQHRKKTGSILNFPGATDIKKSTDALELDCDILIPAALENVINGENAPRIKAQIIGEGAIGPLTPEADDHFAKKGTIVIPDMYLNAGGVTVSYFEWLKNLSHVRYGRMEKRFTENVNSSILNQIEELTGKKSNDHARKLIMHGPEEVDLVYSGLEEALMNATHEIMNAWRENPAIPDMRTAAYVVAINKVATIYAELGIFP